SVAGLLQNPLFPLSAAGGFTAIGELLGLVGPVAKGVLEAGGPLTFLAPTDEAFELAISSGALPSRPWLPGGNASLTSSAAEHLLLSHALETLAGAILFLPSAVDPFASSFLDESHLPTFINNTINGTAGGPDREVTVRVRLVEMGTSSTLPSGASIKDKEVYVDNARVYQCVEGLGVGHDCGTRSQASNTFALNGAHLCAVHAIDRVIFPPESGMDIAQVLETTPGLGRFATLLREVGLSVGASSSWSWSGGVGSEGDSAFTVFAPTDEALARLEEERPWLFSNSSSGSSSRFGSEGRGSAGGDHLESGDSEEDDGEGQSSVWNPLRELLAYHLVPGPGLFSRYLNSSQTLPTLALGGLAPLNANFTEGVSLRVNLEECDQIDIPAVNGVIHVLRLTSPGPTLTGDVLRDKQAAAEYATEKKDELVPDCSGGQDCGCRSGDCGNRADDGLGQGRGGGKRSSGGGKGVLVPDVLELTYAWGFRKTYASVLEAAMGAGAEAAATDVEVSRGMDLAEVLVGPKLHTFFVVGDTHLEEYSLGDVISEDILRYVGVCI
ncbi:unnamed protein product, partial [Choristocarpus tenellus]